MNRTKDDCYSDQEVQHRTKAALRAAFNKPPKPQSEMKLGKRRTSRGKSPGASKRRSQAKKPAQ